MERYCLSLYGSNLWRLEDCLGRLNGVWNTAKKLAWNVHRGCRSYFLDNVLTPGSLSLKTAVLTRLLGFFHSLLLSPSHETKVLAILASRDLRSNLGSNVNLVKLDTGIDPWILDKEACKSILTNKYKTSVPLDEVWRVRYLETLVSDRLVAHYYGNDEEEQRLSNLINSLVIN